MIAEAEIDSVGVLDLVIGSGNRAEASDHIKISRLVRAEQGEDSNG